MTGTGCHEVSHPDTNTVHPRQAQTWPHFLKAHEQHCPHQNSWERNQKMGDISCNLCQSIILTAQTTTLFNTSLQLLNQGSCLHLLLWHHPVIIFFSNSFDEKWIISFCQHKLKPLPGKSVFFFLILWGQGATQWLLQLLSINLPGKNEPVQDQHLWGKFKKWKKWGSCREWCLEPKIYIISADTQLRGLIRTRVDTESHLKHGKASTSEHSTQKVWSLI